MPAASRFIVPRQDGGAAMAEMKTRATGDSVEAFLDRVEPAERGTDARAVIASLKRVTGKEPRMWGPSIIGFGSYHYRYESGREGDMCRLGLSPRKANLVLYLSGGHASYEALLGRLGKFSTGKGCLYVKRLTDVDRAVLDEILASAWARSLSAYPE
jgi:hypothetical protein